MSKHARTSPQMFSDPLRTCFGPASLREKSSEAQDFVDFGIEFEGNLHIISVLKGKKTR